MITSRGLAATIGELQAHRNNKAKGIEDDYAFLNSVWNHFTALGSNYLYFSSQDITEGDIPLYAPIPPHWELFNILGNRAPSLEYFTKLSSIDKRQNLATGEREIIDRFITYALPILSDFIVAGFPKAGEYNAALKELQNTEMYKQGFVKGKLGEWETVESLNVLYNAVNFYVGTKKDNF